MYILNDMIGKCNY